jgi:hypothetical protein
LHLVDQERVVPVGDEAAGVGACGAQAGAIVERAQRTAVLSVQQLEEGRFARLPRSVDDHDSKPGERFVDQRHDPARQQIGGHRLTR